MRRPPAGPGGRCHRWDPARPGYRERRRSAQGQVGVGAVGRHVGWWGHVPQPAELHCVLVLHDPTATRPSAADSAALRQHARAHVPPASFLHLTQWGSSVPPSSPPAGRFRYMASLRNASNPIQPFCDGTLIHPRVVLTAAHVSPPASCLGCILPPGGAQHGHRAARGVMFCFWPLPRRLPSAVDPLHLSAAVRPRHLHR